MHSIGRSSNVHRRRALAVGGDPPTGDALPVDDMCFHDSHIVGGGQNVTTVQRRARLPRGGGRERSSVSSSGGTGSARTDDNDGRPPDEKKVSRIFCPALALGGAVVVLVVLAASLGSGRSRHLPTVRPLFLGEKVAADRRGLGAVSKEEVYEYPHDHPDHPWHWSRENPPDPALYSQRKDCDGVPYSSLYHHFHQYGYVIFRSCSLMKAEGSVLVPAGKFTATIDSDRATSSRNKAVRALSMDPDSVEFIEYLHGGRRAFPFQTLNFPKGTQQPIHSDLIHFDTMPRTLMTAAWTALEDTNAFNGPLKFYPGSHHFGTNDYDEIGLRQKHSPDNVSITDTRYNSWYGEKLEEYLNRGGLKAKVADEMVRGQTLVWAAGLAHGGSKQRDKGLSRLSQVTHYYFEGAEYYWVPRLSHINRGEIKYSQMHLVGCKTSPFAPRGLHSCADGHIHHWMNEIEDAEEL